MKDTAVSNKFSKTFILIEKTIIYIHKQGETSMKKIEIGNKLVGDEESIFIVAEIGVCARV